MPREIMGIDKSSDLVPSRRSIPTWLIIHFMSLVFVLSALFFVLYSPSLPNKFFSRPLCGSSSAPNNSTIISEGGDELDKILKRASMEDKTVILTNLNQAWARPNSLLDIFLDSFKKGNQTCRLLNHLVIVALDQYAYTRCLAVHPHCYALGNNTSNKEAFFMTPDYLKLVLKKIEFLTSVLEKGYNFVFTDTDIMWLQNPFPRFHVDTDFQVASDHFVGEPSNMKNKPNTGLLYVKSNCRTIVFFKFWNASKDTFPGMHDQDVFNNIKFDSFISELGLTIKFLDTAYFSGFCEYGKDINLLCTMHANCRVGIEGKIRSLNDFLERWKKSMSSIPSLEGSSHSWSLAQNCSVANFHPAEMQRNNQIKN